MTADILLLNPPVRTDGLVEEELMTVPLCLCYLAAPLIEEGFTVKIIDMVAENMTEEDLIPVMRREAPSIVGITATTRSYFLTMKIADMLKKVNPATTVVLGGSHATARPVESLKETPAVDIVVFREGDHSFLEVARAVDRGDPLEPINGIVYRRKESIRMTSPRPFINNLDTLPLPATYLVPLNPYLYYPVSGGRGCPGRCIFCASGYLSGYTHRSRSVQNILGELTYAHEELGQTSFFFTDDTFTIKRERTLQLCEAIQRETLDIQWYCEARVDTITKDILENMKDAGCTKVLFGVESGSQKILNSIKKGITIQQVKKAVTTLVDVGIPHLLCSFMIGHPEDTVETVRKSFDLARFIAALPDKRASKTQIEISFTVTIPFPGTYLYENAEELGVEILADSWEQYTTGRILIRTKNLDETLLRRLQIESPAIIRAMSHKT
jgi:radical SAM superfamily enzyme YgiQ (UPF0313 family)